jgi:hypothetical protein
MRLSDNNWDEAREIECKEEEKNKVRVVRVRTNE